MKEKIKINESFSFYKEMYANWFNFYGEMGQEYNFNWYIKEMSMYPDLKPVVQIIGDKL